MVTGGWGSSRLDTTEVYKDRVWIVSAGKLPVAISNLAGTTIGNRAMIFGIRMIFFQCILFHFEDF